MRSGETGITCAHGVTPVWFKVPKKFLHERHVKHTKVRYRGLAKNNAQIVTLFALSNLWMVRPRQERCTHERQKSAEVGLIRASDPRKLSLLEI